jgi:hypothetical protein
MLYLGRMIILLFIIVLSLTNAITRVSNNGQEPVFLLFDGYTVEHLYSNTGYNNIRL